MANEHIKLDVVGMELAMTQLSNIQSPVLRGKIVNRAARQVMKSAKDRVSKQIDIDGKPFGDYGTKTRHKRPRGRNRKMLARLAKKLAIFDQNDFGVTVGWRNSYEASIAAKHQFGFTQTVTKEQLAKADAESARSKAPRSYKQADKQREFGPVLGVKMATKQQAIALIMANYKVKIKGRGKDRVISEGKGGLKTPSIKWITQHLTLAKAGLILRLLRDNGGREAWRTTLPARPFLGISADDLETIAMAIREEISKTLKGAK